MLGHSRFAIVASIHERLFHKQQADHLLISDPKALGYIFRTSAYRFPKTVERRHLSRASLGDGVFSADGIHGSVCPYVIFLYHQSTTGEVHRRMRKIMLPSFGGPESRALLPIFVSNASKVRSGSLIPTIRNFIHRVPIFSSCKNGWTFFKLIPISKQRSMFRVGCHALRSMLLEKVGNSPSNCMRLTYH